MAYPGNQELSAEARQRVLTAFHQVIAKLQDGRRDEALIGLEFVLRLDPGFSPAAHLQEQLASGGDVDLADIVGLLQGGTSVEVDQILVDAVEDFNERRFDAAREKALRVIGELPGHTEARALLSQIDEAVKRGSQVEQYLGRAREALGEGNAQGAAEFVMMAQALDPHHPDIGAALAELEHASTALGPAATETAAQSDTAPPAEISPPAPPSEPPQRPEEAAAPPSAQDESVPSPPEPEDSGFSFSFGEGAADAGGSFGDFSVDEAAPEPALGEGSGTPLWDTDSESPSDFSFAAEPAQEPATEGLDADVADLFADDGAVELGGDADSGAQDADSDSQRVQELLEQGRELYNAERFQEAIDVLSRVFLIDPGHEGATRLVEDARARKDELDRKAEHLLYEAQDAADAGKADEALRLADEVLALQPGHLEALALKDRLASAPGAPAPPPESPDTADAGASPTPERQEESFGLPDMEPAPDMEAAVPEGGLEEPPPPPAEPGPRRRALPWRIIALAAGGLLVVLVGVFFGSQLLSSGDEGSSGTGVDTVLQQAQELYQQGRAEEAVHLLQEYPASGLDQARVARRLAEYQKALAPPTPTPIPTQLPAAEKALDEGRLLESYTLVLEGLKQFPHDSGLVQLRERILQHEPLVAQLVRASQDDDSSAALSVSRELAERHPANPEFQRELDRHLFNVSVQELRGYNLTGAAVHLQELARRRPKDAEVQRILDFINKYKTRPADMQLKIFIASLSLR